MIFYSVYFVLIESFLVLFTISFTVSFTVSFTGNDIIIRVYLSVFACRFIADTASALYDNPIDNDVSTNMK